MFLTVAPAEWSGPPMGSSRISSEKVGPARDAAPNPGKGIGHLFPLAGYQNILSELEFAWYIPVFKIMKTIFDKSYLDAC
ncbi:MAG: hypothetical protein GKC10_03085 [Methanosarcinales archaeon]|nr:hypothetical protein [Methanosarcinales archaeon]